MINIEVAVKMVITDKHLTTIIDKQGGQFTILDFITHFEKAFPKEWHFLVNKYGLYGSGTRYSALTYLSNRLSKFSRRLNQQVLIATPRGWTPEESRFLRKTTKKEREHFGSSWIVVFNKKQMEENG